MANITIKELLAADKVSELVDKINFNFDQLLLNGGGPKGGPGGPGGEPCFTLNFPLTISFPDGTQVVVNTKEEIKAAARAWNMSNPGLHTRPVFVFPITVTLRDGTLLVVNSKEELIALKEECRG